MRPGLVRRGALAGLMLWVSGCATTGDDEVDVAGAAAQPLQDLNLQKTDIPDVLRAALVDPYRPPPRACATVVQELAALDAALGPDLDVKPVEDDEGAEEFVEGAVRDVATGWIPFRSVVRRMTGAAAHDRKVEAAGIAGSIRRGYLKGYGERAGCRPPAAPVRRPAPPAN